MTKGVGIIGPATVGGIKVSYMYVEFAIDLDFTKSQSLLVSLDAFESEILAACWTILSCANYIAQDQLHMYQDLVGFPMS